MARAEGIKSKFIVTVLEWSDAPDPGPDEGCRSPRGVPSSVSVQCLACGYSWISQCRERRLRDGDSAWADGALRVCCPACGIFETIPYADLLP
jgi:hypothetical protein